MAKTTRTQRNDSTGKSTPNWHARVAELEERVAALQALQESARTLTSELVLDQLLAKILQNAVQVMRASAGSLLLHDGETNELVFSVVQGGGGEALKNTRIRNNQGIAGAVFTSRQPSIVQDVQTDKRFLKGIDTKYGFQTTSMIAVPMLHKNEPVGVIEVMNKKTGDRFNDNDKELLLAFAAQSAVAIQNAQLYQQVVAERDRIIVVEEQVRRGLARDLHDGPSQLISAIIMEFRFLKEVINRKPEKAQEELAHLEELATHALHQVRNLVFDLRPLILETQGLAAALELYVQKQRESEGFNLQLDTDGFTARLVAQSEAAIFSIVQEAVNNARKHAEAKNVWIAAQQKNGFLTITVQDDGRGFDVASVEGGYSNRGSLGLLNMKERAEIASAKLSIASQVGKGTLVSLVMPIGGDPAPKTK